MSDAAVVVGMLVFVVPVLVYFSFNWGWYSGRVALREEQRNGE